MIFSIKYFIKNHKLPFFPKLYDYKMLLRWVGLNFLANCLFMKIYWLVDLELLDLDAVKSFYWDLLVTGGWIYEKLLLSNRRNDSSRN
jgi:hypothetical protein